MKPAASPNSRTSASSAAKVASAIRQTWKGCALVMGSMPITARIEFCHSAARHRKTMATDRQKAATRAFAMWRARSAGSGNSR
jgi:hypothetical protein